MSEPLIRLLPYQRRWLADKSKFKAAMVCRQGGKTKFMAAIEVVEDMMAAESRGEKTRWIWLSRGERQAKEAMTEAIAPLFKIYGAAVAVVNFEWASDDDPEIKYAASEITLPGGSRITALPANPDTARGFTANVVLDEFAFHQDSRKIWAALFPVVSKPGLKLRVLSTPNGKGNKFYEIMTGTDSLWSRHVIDIYQAIAEGLDRNLEELRIGCGDDDLFAQEYELKWLDEAHAWMSMDLITAAEDPDAGIPAKYAGGFCFVGNDISATRGRDLWIAWVWEIVGDVLWTREIKVLKRAKFAEHDAAIAEINGRYRMARLAMDQTGMGEKPVQDMQRIYPGRVDGVLFNPVTKLAMATVGKSKFEERKVRIPEGDTELRADLHKPKKVIGPTGIPHFIAESDAAGHADRFWAAMLGIVAAWPGNKFPDPDIFFYSGDDAGPEEDAYAALQRKGPERFIRQPMART